MISRAKLEAQVREAIEAKASRIREWREFPEPSRAGDTPYTTIINGDVKAEGALITDMIEKGPGYQKRLLAAADRFVARCLSIGGGKTLVWRSFPGLEIDNPTGRAKIRARLAWID